MKKFFKILILCILASLPLKSELYNAGVDIKTNEPMPYKISNLLFGGFLEFVTNVIDSPTGLWAQDLLDRGFDIPREDWQTSSYWNIHKEGQGAFGFHLNPGGYNKRGTHMQHIEATNTTTGSMAGVYQNIFQNDTVGMDFYVYMRGNIKQNASYKGVYLYVFDTTMTRVLRFYALGSPDSNNWKKSSIKIAPTKGYNRVTLMIAIHGDGWVELDEASCMPSDNVKGVRKEQYDLLKKWKPGVLRYPGGGFISVHEHIWYETIGDIDQRTALMGGDRWHRMDFGYDEFLQLCEDLNIEPYFSVRYLGVDKSDPANLVEYCNGGINSKWGKIRAQNGHPAPYKVKYWEIGNEEYYFDPSFASNYKMIHDEMSKKDPTISYIAGLDIWGTEESFQRYMDTIGNITQIIANHPIVFNTPQEPTTDEEIYISNSTVGINIQYALKKFEKWMENDNLLPRVKQAATEWGYTYEFWPWSPFDRVVAGGSLGLSIYMADQLFAFIRCANSLIMANITYQMNFIRGGYNKNTNQRSIFGTPSYYVMAMMSNHFGEYVYNSTINSPLIEQRSIGGLWNPSNYPWLDAIATGNEDTLFVYVTNKHPKDSALVNINIDNISNYDSLNVYQLASKSYLDANTFEEPNLVVPKDYRWKKSESYIFPPHSFTILAIPRKYKPIDDSSVISGVYYNIYPNPANDYININYKFTNSPNLIAKIVDILGNEMLSENLDTFEYNNVIDISTLPPGVYFLKILYDKGIYYTKFVKN